MAAPTRFESPVVLNCLILADFWPPPFFGAGGSRLKPEVAQCGEGGGSWCGLKPLSVEPEFPGAHLEVAEAVGVLTVERGAPGLVAHPAGCDGPLLLDHGVILSHKGVGPRDHVLGVRLRRRHFSLSSRAAASLRASRNCSSSNCNIRASTCRRVGVRLPPRACLRWAMRASIRRR